MRWLNSAAQMTVLVSLLVGAGACTKSAPHGETPEAALEAYVKTAFSISKVEDAQALLNLSTGDAKEWLASMSKEKFEEQFVKNKMTLQSLSMKDVRHEQNGDVSLVYEIAFKDGNPDGKPTGPSVFTNKKIAYLTKEGNEWKIKATKNVKSYIERKDALEIPPNPPGYQESDDVKPEAKGKK